MPTGLNPLLKGTVAVVIFSLFIILFSIQFLNETNPNILVNSSLQDYSNKLQGDVGNLTFTVDNAKNKLENSQLSPLYLFILFENAFWIPLSYLGFLIKSAVTLPLILFPSLSGTGMGSALTIGLSVIFTILISTAVFLIIKAIRTGESER